MRSRLRELARGRADLLAEAAGLHLGTAEGKLEEYRVRAQAIAELCRLAGADEDAIPGWIREGRRRAGAAKLPPFSRPAVALRRAGHARNAQALPRTPDGPGAWPG